MIHRNRINAPCTVILAVMNVLVFFALTLQGMTEDGTFLLEHGAMFVPKVVEDGRELSGITGWLNNMNIAI